jgi:hypothetical protein
MGIRTNPLHRCVVDSPPGLDLVSYSFESAQKSHLDIGETKNFRFHLDIDYRIEAKIN